MPVLNHHLDREAIAELDPHDRVLIMRPSRWGNPFRIGMVRDGRQLGRADVLAA
jgi:hypothetical protein